MVYFRYTIVNNLHKGDDKVVVEIIIIVTIITIIIIIIIIIILKIRHLVHLLFFTQPFLIPRSLSLIILHIFLSFPSSLLLVAD
jgi:hypothetical protein